MVSKCRMWWRSCIKRLERKRAGSESVYANNNLFICPPSGLPLLNAYNGNWWRIFFFWCRKCPKYQSRNRTRFTSGSEVYLITFKARFLSLWWLTIWITSHFQHWRKMLIKFTIERKQLNNRLKFECTQTFSTLNKRMKDTLFTAIGYQNITVIKPKG